MSAPTEVLIHNTLTRKKEKFEPSVEGKVGMYVCGPTVYGDPHLGHARGAITFDTVFRFFTKLGYKVRYVRNITDVGHLEDEVAEQGEDKITKKARLEQLEPMEVVMQYTRSYHHAVDALNCWRPSIEPTATGHIMEQIEVIDKILGNGYAYESQGSVYFDVEAYAKDHNYGELSGKVLEDLRGGTRDLDGQEEKRNSYDFALWKKASDAHIMKWQAPWSVGFPGWHIECTTMSAKYLGTPFDIHGGGMDLQFPHHESEIAQSVCAHGEHPARYWMHNNMLTINGEKMAKSKGNFITMDEVFSGNHELLEQAYSPMTIRFFTMQAHYGSTLDFSNSALQAAEKGVQKLFAALKIAQGQPGKLNGGVGEQDQTVEQLVAQAYQEMADDFNTAKTIAVLFEMAGLLQKLANQQLKWTTLSAGAWEKLSTEFTSFVVDVLGLQPEGAGNQGHTEGLVNMLIDIRQEAKVNKDYALSDQIRDKLKDMGISLMDSKEGTTFSID